VCLSLPEIELAIEMLKVLLDGLLSISRFSSVKSKGRSVLCLLSEPEPERAAEADCSLMGILMLGSSKMTLPSNIVFRVPNGSQH